MVDRDRHSADDQRTNTDPLPPLGQTVRTLLRRAIALVSVAMLIIGVMILWSGFRLRSKCFEAEAAAALDVSVDIGTAGRHLATLKQIASFTCRQHIRMDPKLHDSEDVNAQLRGLELAVSVQDAKGVEWMSGVFPSQLMGRTGESDITIADGTPMPVGEYSVIIDVVNPAPALAGRPVRFVSKYVLCGIEWMGPTIGIGGGAVVAAIGAIIGGTLFATRRKVPANPSSR